MKWVKPYGLVMYSSVTVDLDETVIIDEGNWGNDNPDFVETELDKLRLDPGGMLFNNVPWHTFTVRGYSFEIQRHNIEHIMNRVLNPKELKPGCSTFYTYPGIAVTMTDDLCAELYSKLDELSKEDATMHTSLDVALVKDKLNEHPNILMNIKKEMPDAE